MFSASKPRHPKRPPAPCVVYGPAFWNGDEMLALHYGTARGCADYYLARNHAATWAGFLAALPADDREYLHAGGHEATEFAGLAEYSAQRAAEEEEITRDQAWSDYLDLSWPDERPPSATSRSGHYNAITRPIER